MARVTFEKYEGLGNDFVLAELAPGSLPPGVVERLCDRHFGVGADGLLLIGRGTSAGAAATMTVLNADGSRSEMCGNGLRCVALYLAARRGSAVAELVVDTDAGPRSCRVDHDQVTVDMGPLVDQGPIEMTIDGRRHDFRRISAGNPHAVTFEPHEPSEVDRIGPLVAIAPAFVGGTNVEFARCRDDGSIDLVVWERGVGRTLACGTGACATVGAACWQGRRSFGESVLLHLPGGTLQVSVERETFRATMRGPARFVFQGEVTLP